MHGETRGNTDNQKKEDVPKVEIEEIPPEDPAEYSKWIMRKIDERAAKYMSDYVAHYTGNNTFAISFAGVSMSLSPLSLETLHVAVALLDAAEQTLKAVEKARHG